VHTLTRLTPGDFAAVRRQSRLRPLHSASDWVKALQAECALKPQTKTSGMVERFNGRIADVLKTHRFTRGEDFCRGAQHQYPMVNPEVQ
jgi:hypothetical protein